MTNSLRRSWDPFHKHFVALSHQWCTQRAYLARPSRLMPSFGFFVKRDSKELSKQEAQHPPRQRYWPKRARRKERHTERSVTIAERLDISKKIVGQKVVERKVKAQNKKERTSRRTSQRKKAMRSCMH